MTDRKELITAACDKEQWLDDDFLLMLRQMTTEDDTFNNALFDALTDAGLDPVELGAAMDAAESRAKKTPVTTNNGKTVPVINAAAALVCAADVEEQETEWLVPMYIPRNQITTLAADGGTGKTTIACALAAGITTGKQSFISAEVPFDGTPENVLFLSREDDFSRVLLRRLRVAGADMKRIFTIPIESDVYRTLKFGSRELEQLVATCKPGLVIFDPIQEFVPPHTEMSSRSDMRQCMSELAGIGEKYHTAFLLIAHTNKQTHVSGRKRIAESADIWDISRSVLIAGETREGNTRYLSHEKSSYGELQPTILYELDGNGVVYKGRSELKDADYIRRDRLPRPAPARAEAKDIIIQTLDENGGEMKADDLDAVLTGQGISKRTKERAKSELKQEKVIRYWKMGFGQGEWMVAKAL